MRAWLRKHAGALGAGAAIVALFLLSYLNRTAFLLATPFPLGIDGYYYPIQIRSLLEHGHLYYPSSPLVPTVMAAVGYFCPPIIAAKLVAAAGTAILVLPVYVLGRQLSKERGPAILAATIVATSAESFYLCTEFVKQGVGLTVAAATLALAWWAVTTRTRPSWQRWTLVLLGTFAAFLTHKTTAVLVLALAAPMWMGALRRHRVPVATVFFFVVAASVVGVGLWAPESIPGSQDAALLGRSFGAADFRLPVLALPGQRALEFHHEVAQAATVALGLLALQLAARSGWPRTAVPLSPLAIGLMAFALFLGVPWLAPSDAQGLAFRLRLCAFLPLGPLAALLLTRLLARTSPRTRAAAALGISCGLLLGYPSSSSEGVVRTHPALAAAVEALEGAVPANGIVVTPERSIMFMATWYARVPARLRPSPRTDPTRIYRLLNGAFIQGRARTLRESALGRALDALRANPSAEVLPIRDLHPLAANGLVLLSEATWRYLLEQLPAPTRAYFARWPTR